MTITLEERFKQPVTGPAYRTSARLFAIGTVIGLVAAGVKVLGHGGQVPWPILMLLALANGVVLVSAWYIVTGKTTIDEKGIRQDWMGVKDYRWHDIARASFVRMPFTARLVLTTGYGPFKAIHSGSPALDAAFRQIAGFYSGRNT